MRKSENLCNLGENNTIISSKRESISQSSIINSNKIKSSSSNNSNNSNKLNVCKSSRTNSSITSSRGKWDATSRFVDSDKVPVRNPTDCKTRGGDDDDDDSNVENSQSSNKNSLDDDCDEEKSKFDLKLACELAKALRAQDHERFIEIYDYHVPSHFDRNRVSETILYINTQTHSQTHIHINKNITFPVVTVCFCCLLKSMWPKAAGMLSIAIFTNKNKHKHVSCVF